MFLSDSYGQCNDFKKSYGLRKIRGDWWKEFYLDMGNVSKEGNVVFTNGKKPLRLIQQLIHMVTSGNEIVLDFFAGFRVIIVTVANSLGNIRVFELLPKLKTKKYGWCIA